ncbi:MAG TPA: hypothetical protein VK698_28440 [Kofleriaceae bacterium]|nr:hypothetical protein [Kofleriaceae bacterium]
MGVTVHFYAFDPRVHTAGTTIERLVADGALDHELNVLGSDRGLTAIESRLGDNKRWNDNLAGDHAWDRAREHVEPVARAGLDAWFSHLFWDRTGQGCPCGREPVIVAEGEVIFDDALIGHILSLGCPLAPVEPALAAEFEGDPPRTERLDRPWIYDFDLFSNLVAEHQQVFTDARKAGPGWHLLRWVWT